MNRKETRRRYYLKHKEAIKARVKARYYRLKNSPKIQTPSPKIPTSIRIDLDKFDRDIRMAMMNKQPYLYADIDSKGEATKVE